MDSRRAVRLAIGFAVMVLFLASGQWMSRVLSLPVPGSVVGMVLLTFALRFGPVPMSVVREAAALLLRHMGLFFVPAGVGVMRYTGLLRAEWPSIVGACVVSTLVVMATVGALNERLAHDA